MADALSLAKPPAFVGHASPLISIEPTERLQRAMLGTLNTEHYLRAFARFDGSVRARLGWNWGACLCSFNWMLLRRLWVEAVVYAAALSVLVVAVLGGARLLHAPDAVQWLLAAALVTVAFALPGALGDTLLYRAYRRRCAAALASASTLDAACAELARVAPTRHRVLGLLVLNAVAAAIALTVWNGGRAARMPERAAPAAPAAAPVAPTLPSTPASAASAAAPALPSTPTAQSASMPTPAPAPAWTEDEIRALDAAMARYVSRRGTPSSAEPPSAKPVPTPAPKARAAERRARAASAASTASAAAPTPAASSANTPASAPAPAASTPASPASAAPADAASAPASTPAASSSTARYRVNIAVFADADNARRATERLQAAGLPADASSVETARGTRTRLRAGPFATRAEADAAAARIRALQLEAVVVPVR